VLLVAHSDTHQEDAMTIDPETQEEIARLGRAVDAFAVEMKARLREQAVKGYRGWDDPENYQRIVEMMVKHAAVGEGEEVDVANLAMILWSLRRRADGDEVGDRLAAKVSDRDNDPVASVRAGSRPASTQQPRRGQVTNLTELHIVRSST
jgi:hypothetical protein